MVRYALTEPPDTIAKSMLDLIQLTREQVTNQASALSVTPRGKTLKDEFPPERIAT